MSDYFGALLRSSGLLSAGLPRASVARDVVPAALEEAAVDTGGSATGVPTNGLSANGVNTSGAIRSARDASQASASSSGAPGDTRSPTAALPHADATIQRAQAAAIASPSPSSAPVAPPFAATPQLTSAGALQNPRNGDERATNIPNASETHTATPQRIAAPSEAMTAWSEPSRQPASGTGASRVRAALQWIAADPHSDDAREGRQPSAAHAALATPLTPRNSAVDETHSAATREPPAARERDDTAPLRNHAIEAWLREPAPSQASRRSREQDDTAGNLVEVSIGAIHLRVDAPAAQTRLAAAPPAAAPRPANRTPPRDAVARRLLRRI